MKERQPLSIAGLPAPRLDGVEKVTGKAFYTGDVELRGMGFAKILRSPLPHARLIHIDARKAESLPGVYAVLTRDDIKGLNYLYGATYKDQSIVAVDKVRYAGDPVAATLAVDEATAEEALALIDVEYDDLPAVTNIEEAIAPGASLVHEGESVKAELRGSRYSAPEKFRGTNVCYYFGYNRGDVAEGFKKSDYVYEDVFRFPKVQHYSLEPHVTVANFEEDRLTVWTACQDPFTLRDHLAGIFNLPLSRVRVIVPYVGGAYGGKLHVKAEPIAAALSWKARRPAKLALSVSESFKTTTRHPARIRIKTGVTREGRIVARECEVHMDTGAYADTDVTPYDVSTSASSSMTVMGLAVQRAAQDVKKQLLHAAARVMGKKADQLVLKNGKVCSRGGQGIPFGKVISDHFGSKAGEIIGRGIYRDVKSKKAVLGSPTTFWEVAWGGAEVEVDPETGAIQILKYVSVADVGKAINPVQCLGQDEGAVFFALGHTLYEEMIYEDGQLLNPNLVDYRVPTFCHLPKEFSSILIENGNGPGPFGSKGMGEGGLLPVASAIANAVSNAVGVRIYDLPLTPEKLWRALSNKLKSRGVI